MAKHYQELPEQHSKELSQLLDDFGESQEELQDHLMERTTQHAVLVTELETAGIEGPANNPEGNNPQESADPTNNEQTQPI